MSAPQLTLLILGIILFFVALGLTIYLSAKDKPIKAVLVLFPVSILMIGFTSVVSADVIGVKFQLNTAQAYVNNPNNPGDVGKYQQEITHLEQEHQENPTKPLAPAVRSELSQTVAALSRRSNLSPASRQALVQTQYLLSKAPKKD